ncbi:hypothetical protein SAMN04487936_10563 [Halobacillus dabanensis]|uniref:Uncharacterized protein n=1 Tax=Halobacillus dabanensis TaxID=240302 RepID=A0A1I3UZG1_HALDA|nr:hypothetical protein [Halobacillus dabanensis]SFJ88312.1 hypothetical protein SAMN04487936_10563 [Halobacillus dabanensis]
MKQKPIHYDGSGQVAENVETPVDEPLEVTDEMRKNISANPYEIK